MSGLGPAELQILISRLTGVAEEMGAVLRRAAFSPNIKERADCSAALFTADGELLVQAEHIPVHLGSMPASVAAAIEAFGGGGCRPGDQVVLNDPFAGGTHLNDLTLVAPCFLDGRLVGWAANRAHHADVGGMAPGSIPADATEIYQEGLRIPPVLLTAAVEDILCANSRTPDERRGDLDAQRGANVVGVERLAALAATGAPFDEVTAYGERRMRAALADVPDGRWTFADVIDSCGPSPEQQRPAHIEVTLTVDGETATFDFTGTDAPAAGQRERGRGRHRERGGLRPPVGDRPHHPRQRGRPAAGHGDRARRHAGRGPSPGGGRGGQRRGQPAGGRRVPRRAGPGPPRPPGRGQPGDDEQHPRRRDGVGLLRDGRRRAGRPARAGPG